VSANRARVARELGVPADRLVWMNQVHGTQVTVVDGPQDGAVPATDALVTATPGLVLCVLVADCVPVLLADHETGVVAAVHAGREGVRLGVVAAALSAMASLGARARHVTALLGPAVCGSCYEVPAEMQREVARVAPAAAVGTRRGTPGLDLRAGIAEGLYRAGIPQVVLDPRCTVEDPTLFSHRREGVTGRQAGMVWLPL
jgi:YfiH family protein